MGGFEILEHTADVGIRATGATLEETFEQATRGLLAITGTWKPDGGEPMPIDVHGDDLGALLVDWLQEVLYLQDARDSVITSPKVESVTPKRARGTIGVAARGDEVIEGTAVKAITYHQLRVERKNGNWIAQVYFDI